MDVVRFKHARNSGDLIGAMPGMQQIYHDTGKKSVIYQQLGLIAYYYENAQHPLKNENGHHVCMNEKQWSMLVPLLEAQEYIDHCEVFTGQTFDIDLDKVMHDKHIPMPAGDLHFWTFFIVPEMACDLSKTWINPIISVASFGIYHEQYKDNILINRTQRYQNPHITYFFLKQYESNLLFAGTGDERDLFCKQWQLPHVPLLKVENFSDLAQVIQCCKFGIFNQSMCWHIADAMKTPRILEYCPQFPNTHPTGANGYAFIHQQALELYTHKLFNQ